MTRRFQLKLKEEKVELEAADGTIRVYTVKEMIGKARYQFLNQANKRVKMSADGKLSQIKDVTGMFSDLLALCVYDDKGVLVSSETIQGWPASVEQEIFNIAQEINGLNAKAEEEAKNA